MLQGCRRRKFGPKSRPQGGETAAKVAQTRKKTPKTAQKASPRRPWAVFCTLNGGSVASAMRTKRVRKARAEMGRQEGERGGKGCEKGQKRAKRGTFRAPTATPGRAGTCKQRHSFPPRRAQACAKNWGSKRATRGRGREKRRKRSGKLLFPFVQSSLWKKCKRSTFWVCFFLAQRVGRGEKVR